MKIPLLFLMKASLIWNLVSPFTSLRQPTAKIYKKCGQESKALTMYTDLRMFDLANEYLGSGDSADRRLLIKV